MSLFDKFQQVADARQEILEHGSFRLQRLLSMVARPF
jgi:hypothetical protein